MITKFLTAALFLLTVTPAFANDYTIVKETGIWTITKTVIENDAYCVMDIDIDKIPETDGLSFSLAEHVDGMKTIVILSEVPYMPARIEPYYLPGIIAFDGANVGVGRFEPYHNTGLALQSGIVDENFTARFVETKVLSVFDAFSGEKAELHLTDVAEAYSDLRGCVATLQR